MRSRPLLLAAIATVFALSAAGCSDSGLPMPTPTPSPTYPVTGDGVLKIGTLFSLGSGTAAAQVAGVEAAVREINEAGGLSGVPVELYHRNAGTAATDTVEAAYADLVAKGVDVVIGPSSSALVEQLVEPVIAAGVPLISPAATASALTALDDSGLIYRTIASYSDQGPVLATAMADAGATKIAYLYFNDDNATALLDSLTAAAEERGMSVEFSGSFTVATSSFASLISKVTKAKPDAVVIASPPEAHVQTAALITALSEAKLGGSALWLTSLNLTDYSQELPAGVLDTVNGVMEGAQADAAFAARLRQADPGVGGLRYALEAYDATILATLAAYRAGDDGGPAIARLLPTVSTKGIPCTSYGACLDVLSTEPDIDYNGISGPVDLTAEGDVAEGSWSIYAYGPTNNLTLISSVIAG